MIQPGDMVLLYHSDRLKYLVEVKDKGMLSTHRGQVDYREVAGRDYGACVKSHLGCRFHILKPSIADLEMKVRRQTTIVYPKDVGTLLLETLVFPGARVIEVGSGSGALTSVLAFFVRPNGRVFSYERRPEFSANARANVARYRLGEYCEFFIRDPELQGFDQTDVDAVLVDVPEPWVLVEPAHKALKGGHVLAAIVPTTEQVRKAVSSLELGGFARIRVREILERALLVRPSGVRPADRMVGHTVYVVLAHKVDKSAQEPESHP